MVSSQKSHQIDFVGMLLVCCVSTELLACVQCTYSYASSLCALVFSNDACLHVSSTLDQMFEVPTEKSGLADTSGREKRLVSRSPVDS